MENTYKNGTERQQRFADGLKKDAMVSINADTKQLLKRSSDATITAKIEAFQTALIDAVTADDDVNSVINKLDMQAWRIDLIAKAYNIKP